MVGLGRPEALALGAAMGTQNAVVITLGTGVGGGFIVDGKLMRGKSGGAGEIHFKRANGDEAMQCTCGIKGCAEASCSGTALNKFAKRFLGEDATSYDVIAGLKTGCAKSLQAFAIWEQNIEDLLIMIGNIFDPDVVVLSGGVGKFVDCKSMQAKVNAKILTQPLKVKHASFENNAGMLGVAMLLADKLC